jgi:hypothetical protein
MSSLKPYLILSREEARSFKKATGFPRRRNQVPCNQPVEVPRRSKTPDDRVGARVARQDNFQPQHQDRRGDIGIRQQTCLVQSGGGLGFPGLGRLL